MGGDVAYRAGQAAGERVQQPDAKRLVRRQRHEGISVREQTVEGAIGDPAQKINPMAHLVLLYQPGQLLTPGSLSGDGEGGGRRKFGHGLHDDVDVLVTR